MSEAPDPEVVELATKIFDLARQGQTEALVAYVDAGVPANLTNDRGDFPGDARRLPRPRRRGCALLARGAADQVNDRGQTRSQVPSSRVRRT